MICGAQGGSLWNNHPRRRGGSSDHGGVKDGCRYEYQTSGVRIVERGEVK